MREIDANTLKRPWVLKFAAADVTRYISQLDDITLSKLLEAAAAEQFRRIDDADYAAAYPQADQPWERLDTYIANGGLMKDLKGKK